MDKIDELQVELAELRSKYNAENAKYDTKVTRKACLIVGGICFILGFIVKAMIF